MIYLRGKIHLYISLRLGDFCVYRCPNQTGFGLEFFRRDECFDGGSQPYWPGSFKWGSVP